MAEPIPDLLTIEEAAAVLRIGRTAAYQLARRYLASGGKEGLPVVRVGRLLRVPRVELEKLIGGPITWPLPGPTTARLSSPSSPRRRPPNHPAARAALAAPAPANSALLDVGLTRRAPPPSLTRHTARSYRQVPAGGVRVMLRVTTLYASSAMATAAYYTQLPGAGARGGAGRVERATGGRARARRAGSTPTISKRCWRAVTRLGDAAGQRVARPDVGGREGGAGGGRLRCHVLGAEVAECVVGAHR